MSVKYYNDEKHRRALKSAENEVIRYHNLHLTISQIYKMIDHLAQVQYSDYQEILQLRANLQENIFKLEDALINSPEWSLSRFVVKIRIALCSSLESTTTSNLVRRFCLSNLPTDCDQCNDCFLGQFKTSLVLQGMPVLVSIKNEKNPIIDENKLLDWGDCIIFVFDFHSILSFQACKSLMKRLRRNGLCLAKIPCILVGIKDDNSIMDINPQMIDKFINDYPNLVYMETCTIHDIKNVSKIFHKACVSALSFKGVLLDTEKLQPQCDPQSSNSTTTCSADIYASQNSVIATAGSALSSLESCNSPVKYLLPLSAPNYQTRSSHISHVNRGVECREQTNNNRRTTISTSATTLKFKLKSPQENKLTESRMSWYRPNIFKTQSRNNNAEKLVVDLALPKTKFGTVLKVVKQGYLMKKSSSSLKQDWKQKYVVIDQEGQLWYYRNVDDFLRGQRGKSLSLKFVTVKQSVGKNASCSTIIRRNRQLTIPDCNISERSSTVPFLRQSISADPYILKTPLFSRLDRKFGKKQTSASTTKLSQYDIRTDVKELADNDNGYITPKSKSRQTQLDECSFTIVPMNGRALMFEAKSHKEREEWIESIQEQITLLLLSNRSKVNEKRNSLTNSNPTIGNVKLLLKPLAGNHICADCSAPDPEWASINLGILVCIDCSGSHRDLGTHISRIRSLDLDIWNEELQTIMKSFGNQFANRIWEAELWEDPKPTPNSHREYKDQWIKWKYNAKRFIPSNCHSLEKEVLLKLVKFIEHRRNRSLYSIIYTYPNIKSVLGRSLEDGRHLTHIAAEVGDVVALQLLLWNGANPSATDSQGNTAMYYAKKSKKNCCENILATYGVNDERRPSTRTASYLSTTASEHNQRLSINLTALHPDSNQRKTIKSDSLKFSKKRMSRKK